MKYIMEKGCTMPLCAIKDDVYLDYFTGEVITNENTINFIKEGIRNKSMSVADIDLTIYKVLKEVKVTPSPSEGYGLPLRSENILCGYNYVINEYSNYLSDNKQHLGGNSREHFIKMLMKGEWKQELIWGVDNE